MMTSKFSFASEVHVQLL